MQMGVWVTGNRRDDCERNIRYATLLKTVIKCGLPASPQKVKSAAATQVFCDALNAV
jgi:hypothetical protein